MSASAVFSPSSTSPRVGGHLAVVGLRRQRGDATPTTFAPTEAPGDELAPDPRLETVVVSTCARRELWIAGSRRLSDDALRRFAGLGGGAHSPTIRRDADAVLHLLRTAAGLDSPLRGEDEILGQLRRAFTRGRLVTRGSLLRGLGQRAIAVGRAVRRLPGLRIDYPAAVAASVPASAERLGVVGSGPFAARIASRLGESSGRPAPRVVLYSHHPERTSQALERAGGLRRVVVRDPRRLGADLPALDVLVTATRDGSPALRREQLATRFRPLRVIDLGAPPTVEASVARHPVVEHSTLEDLHHAVDRPTLERAEALVRRRATATVRWWRRRERLGGRALVLAAHGAGDGSDANRAIDALAASVGGRLGERLGATRVETAFHRGTPGFASLGGRRDAVVLPLLTSRGHYHRRLAEALGPDAAGSLQRPLGEDPRTVALIVDELVARVGRMPRRTLSVLVVGHGTRRDPRSGDATRTLAEAARQALPGARVEAAFLDQEPTLRSVARRLLSGDPRGATTLAVVPFLLGVADHARRDVDAGLRGIPAARRLDLPPLLELPRLASLAVACAVGRQRPLRLGTRSSSLALWQARHVATALGRRGVPVELVPLEAAGDRDLRRPLGTPGAAGLFTDALEARLVDGSIDLAVHSLKDLPLAEHPELELAAIPVRAAAHETLVSRHGLRLAELLPGARVGTSSPRRRAQLLALRPDLEPAPLRGPVDRRIEEVRTGGLDAAVLAAAGVERLGRGDEITEHLALDALLPEAGQGALAVQTRRGGETADLVAVLDHGATRRAARAEREAARALETRLPAVAEGRATVAAHAVERAGILELRLRLLETSPSAGRVRALEVRERGDGADLAERAASRLIDRFVDRQARGRLPRRAA